MLLPNWTDPRPEMDARAKEHERIETERVGYLEVARDLGDEQSIALATRALEELRTLRRDWRDVRAPLHEAIEGLNTAREEVEFARSVDTAGTLDRKCALRNHEAFIVAEAKLRYWAVRIPGLVASCNGVYERLAREANTSTVKKVVAESKEFVAKLFEYKARDRVFADASEAGRRSNAEASQWWPVAEEVARRAFAERLPKEKEARDQENMIRTPSGFFRDHRYEERWLATADDLEKAFANRRAGFAAERQRVAAQLAELGGAA